MTSDLTLSEILVCKAVAPYNNQASRAGQGPEKGERGMALAVLTSATGMRVSAR